MDICVCSSIEKNSNATIGSLEKLLGPHTLKSLDSIESNRKWFVF